jgi:hypothetical protein
LEFSIPAPIILIVNLPLKPSRQAGSAASAKA